MIFSFRGGVAGELVGDHHARCDALLLEQLAQQPLGGFCIATTLHQNIEHDSVLVDGSPEPVLPTCDTDRDLVEVPFVSGGRKTAADLRANCWPNFRAHCRTVSWLTSMPRAASISSTIRRLKGKRKYNQTAWLITSTGKRWRA